MTKIAFFIVLFLLGGSRLFSKTGTPLPMDLCEIPFADQQGIILDVKTVSIRDIQAPYNAALTKNENNNFILVFRYDTKGKGSLKNNYIACVELDENLEQKGNFQTIDTLSDFSNDPRIFKSGKQFYLVYNDLRAPGSQDRLMKIAEINLSDFQLNAVTSLDRHIKKKEKNWIPFSYRTGSAEEIYFIYDIDPYNVLNLDSQHDNQLKQVGSSSKPTNFPWSWGPPRGGTQAELVDGEYLTFFHSSFMDRYGNRWYVMGAFTFEATPPFQVTAVSPHPFLFKGIYSSARPKNVSNRLRCIFPVGSFSRKGIRRSLFPAVKTTLQ